ncbi:MAG: bifunctional 4'-phosphopantothenoylcysteine decarboxylase/phosphopantothenoylcysteine synthetase, partial [Actinomycetota bacterium]|nr:bifunctional 4'-phosphopantothenoylcysteine decarboxylase/phosphopantothenoylcysteine synthetase [Actinomycetota bacterium]
MRDAVLRLAPEAAAVLKAAAVADYRPARSSAHKIRKEEADALQITLERTDDILAELGRSRGARPGERGSLPILVGFAAETDLAETRGREKLRSKGLDLIVVNPVNAPDAGFEVDTNRALLLSADGGRTEIGLTTKAALARTVLDRVEALLAGLADPRRPATAAPPG